MLGNLQHLDGNHFQVLCFRKNSDNIRLEVLPLDGVKYVQKKKDETLLENLLVTNKRAGRICRKIHDRRTEFAENASSFEKTDEAKRTKHGVFEKSETKRSGASKISLGKVRTKCSVKWATYGGRIPLILKNLETVKDLDEALRPWEESLNNKERSIILKVQSSWERALEIFEWFKRKGCHELNVIHYNIMFWILGKARRWNQIESLWEEMETGKVTPTNSTFGTLIDVYGKGGLKEEALLWMETMNKQGMEPDEVTMGIVVQTYKKAGEFEKAEQFFKRWLSGKVTNDGGRTASANAGESCVYQPFTSFSSQTYNNLIDMYGKAGQLNKASDTFNQMLREGVVPNTVTFNTMIHIYGSHGLLEEVTSLMQKMEESHCPLDARTYSILISVHAKHNNISMAASYFAKMNEARLELDPVSYRTILYAFSIKHMVTEAETLVSEMEKRGLQIDEFTQSALLRMYIDAGMLKQSWSWFERFHLRGKMTSECYTANTDAYGERGYTLEAEKVFICCQERNKLSVLEFNVMIKAYGIAGRYDRACQLFESMENHGLFPDACSYSSLIQILSSADLPQKAVLYVRKMQEAGLVSDCIPYSAVISSFAKLGNLEMAEGLFKEMIDFGIKPDDVSFGVLIDGFANVGSIKDATSYVDAMRNAGFPGNRVIYNSLIKLYTKVGYLQQAQEIYRLIRSSGEGPHVYPSNCMIHLYSERRMVRQAEEIFDYLKQRGDANEFSFMMMLCMYRGIGRFEEAVRIAEKMRGLGLLTEVLSYNNVINLYTMDGRLKEAVKTFREMIKSGIEPDDSTFKSLGLVLVKCGVPKKAVCKLEVARMKDTQTGLSSWMSNLCSILGIIDDP